jgi:hypothetical protein
MLMSEDSWMGAARVPWLELRCWQASGSAAIPVLAASVRCVMAAVRRPARPTYCRELL